MEEINFYLLLCACRVGQILASYLDSLAGTCKLSLVHQPWPPCFARRVSNAHKIG